MTVRLRDDRGAEALEFALVSPMVLMIVFGVIYALLAVSAQLSLSYAASVGARHASIPTDFVNGVYPTDGAVVERVAAATPFFAADSCGGGVTGTTKQNDKLTLSVTCDFPNPIGHVVGLLLGDAATTGAFAPVLKMSARAEARRE